MRPAWANERPERSGKLTSFKTYSVGYPVNRVTRRLVPVGLACLAAVSLAHATRRAGADIVATPTPELLPPTGKFAIGRSSFHWVDTALAKPSGDSREILANLWYPAKAIASTETAPYLPDFAALRAAVGEAELKGAAGPAYDALSTARTHAVADAELSPELDKYPVVLLTHGLRYSSLGYSILAEELASNGYVVVGVDHPATAFAMVLPGDRTVIFDEKLWSQRRSAEDLCTFERTKVQECAEDLVFALKQLESLNHGTPDGRFAGRLDLARVGVVGHSFGGRVAARACQIDARLLACALLDSFGRTMHVKTNADGSTLGQPTMVQYARRVPKSGVGRALTLLQNGGKDLEDELRPIRKKFCQSVKADSYELTLHIAGVSHETFSDIPLLESGQTEVVLKNRRRAMQLVRDYTRAFLDRHVKGSAAPLLDQPAANPDEFELTRHTFRGE